MKIDDIKQWIENSSHWSYSFRKMVGEIAMEILDGNANDETLEKACARIDAHRQRYYVWRSECDKEDDD